MHRDLLTLRRTDPVIARRPARIDGAVIGEHAWLLRFFAKNADRLLIVNLGREITAAPLPEPLMAPLQDQAWKILWSSEAPLYGGSGTPSLYRDGNLHVPGESALVLGPAPLTGEIESALYSG
jgi:maltooligosyltrehalose trehalohydrolase